MSAGYMNPNKVDKYTSTKIAINQCLKQFNNLANAVNDACSQAALLGRSLRSLDEIAVPEVIGGNQVNENSSSKKYNSSAHLVDSLETFSM